MPPRKVAGIILGWKLATFAVITIAYFAFEFDLSTYTYNFHHPRLEEPNFWSHLKTWDAHRYLYLAGEGTAQGTPRTRSSRRIPYSSGS